MTHNLFTPDLIKATCLTGTPVELVEQVHVLEQQGLHQIMLYPPLNQQYRVIEDFAEQVNVASIARRNA